MTGTTTWKQCRNQPVHPNVATSGSKNQHGSAKVRIILVMSQQLPPSFMYSLSLKSIKWFKLYLTVCFLGEAAGAHGWFLTPFSLKVCVCVCRCCFCFEQTANSRSLFTKKEADALLSSQSQALMCSSAPSCGVFWPRRVTAC